MTEDEARERWPDISDKERERRRQLSIKAKERHAEVADPETGRRVFGGPQPGSGRKPRKRVAEAVAELAQGTRQKEVIDALFAPLDKSEAAAVRGKGAERIINIEREERALQLKEDEFATKGKDELIDILVKGIKDLGMGQALLEAARKQEAHAPSYDAEGSVAGE